MFLQGQTTTHRQYNRRTVVEDGRRTIKRQVCRTYKSSRHVTPHVSDLLFPQYFGGDHFHLCTFLNTLYSILNRVPYSRTITSIGQTHSVGLPRFNSNHILFIRGSANQLTSRQSKRLVHLPNSLTICLSRMWRNCSRVFLPLFHPSYLLWLVSVIGTHSTLHLDRNIAWVGDISVAPLIILALRMLGLISSNVALFHALIVFPLLLSFLVSRSMLGPKHDHFWYSVFCYAIIWPPHVLVSGHVFER